MEKTGFQKHKIALIAVSVALVICVAYIVFTEYQKVLDGQQLAAYQQGAQFGYQQAISQLLEQVSTCQQVSVTLENQTVQVINVACLSQTEGQ
jgi:hypothetical protein